MNHKEYKIASYGGMLPDMVKIKEDENTFYKRKEAFKNDIKDIINKLNNLINSIDDYYGVFEDIIKSYGNEKRNYFLLQNINEINNFKNTFLQDINKIIDEDNIFNKINNMINLYHKIILPNDDSYPTEEEINKKAHKEIAVTHNSINNQLETPKCKEEKEKPNNLNNIITTDSNYSNDSLCSNNIEINDMESVMMTDDIVDNNYMDFNITKMKKILTLKNIKTTCYKIYVLKDGKIIVSSFSGNSYLYFLFGPKKGEYFDLAPQYIHYLYEMNDGMILISLKFKLVLLNIKEDKIEKIDLLPKLLLSLLRLSNNKFLMFDLNNNGYIYNYKNKDLILEKKIQLNSFKKIVPTQAWAFNEKEIALSYTERGFSKYSFNNYISFFDIEKDKKIKTFGLNKGSLVLCIFNENLIIIGNKRLLFQIDLVKHSKKKEFKLKDNSNIHSIVALNEKQIIVAQTDCINQILLDKDFNFQLLNTLQLGSHSLNKYPKNRLLLTEDGFSPKTLYLYG